MFNNGSGSTQTLAQRKAALRANQKAERDNLAAQHKGAAENIATWGKQQITVATNNLKNVRATVKAEIKRTRDTNKSQKDAMAARHKSALAALN